MKQQFTRGSLLTLVIGCGLGITFCVGIAIGFGFRSIDDNQHRSAAPAITPQMILQAEAATGSEKLGLATGMADNGMEALFALDYTSGDLYCWILNPRVGPGFQAQYVANVEEALGIKKGEPADYVMITGRIDTSGVAAKGNARPGETVCYVGDGNTGRVAGFSFWYSRSRATSGVMQTGELTVVCDAKTRGNIQRD